MRRLGVFMLIAGCSGPGPVFTPDGGDAGSGIDGGTDAGSVIDSGPPRLDGGTWSLWLDAGAFDPTPEAPSAIVYIPAGFDPTPPIAIVVFLHGFNSCAAAAIAAQPVACVDGGLPSGGFALPAQLDDAGVNAVLIVPQLAYDQSTAADGRFATDGGFSAFLDEALAQLQPTLGPLTLADVAQVTVSTVGGGYNAAADIATRGGVPLTRIDLLNALFGRTADFGTFLPAHGFADIYGAGSGTAANSQQLATTALADFGGDAGEILDDRTTNAVTDDQLRVQVIFKLTADTLPGDWPSRLWRTGTLPQR